MSINDPNTANQKPQQQQKPRFGFSFHGGSKFGPPISRMIGTESYVKIKEKLLDLYKQCSQDNNTEIALIDLDNNNERALRFSCLMVSLKYKDKPELGVAYHILIMEGTGDKIPNSVYNLANQRVELRRPTSDALDDDLMRIALDKIRRAYPKGPWMMAGGCVIPENFDVENKYIIQQLGLNAVWACDTELTKLKTRLKRTNPNSAVNDDDDLDLSMFKHDSTLNINIGFNNHQLEDAVGLPMRSDILINFESKSNQQNMSTSVNTGDKEIKVSELSGFIDLLKLPPVAPVNAYYNQAMQGPMPTQKYAARFIITNLASNFSYTPESVLLALSTHIGLTLDRNWIQTFKPSAISSKEIDLRDIGSLNIPANINNETGGYGTKFKTKAQDFKLEDLGYLVNTMIIPHIMVAIDCPLGGPQTWYLSLFAAAAQGKASAISSIIDAANVLTHGNFGKYFNPNEPMFTDLNNRIHNGYWIDKNNQKRDIRDIDYLAVCNLVGDRNPEFIDDWSDTFLKTEYPPLEVRLAAREKMITSLTNETAVFTGYSERITFTPNFIGALLNGIKDTGLTVRINTPLSGGDFSNQRGVATFANSAILIPGQTFQSFATQGSYQQPSQFQFGNQFYNW